MDFKDSDFDRLTFNIYKLDTTKRTVLEYFPILETYYRDVIPKDFAFDESTILKYIILFYDRNSPLQHMDKLMEKKAKAMELCGCPVDDTGMFENEYISVFDGGDYDVNRMIVLYCRMQRSHDFSELVFYDDMFYSEMQNAKIEQDPAKRGKAMDNMTRAKDQIKKLQETLLSGDNSPKLINYLYDEVENESLGLRPEEIAEKLKMKYDPLNGYTPY